MLGSLQSWTFLTCCLLPKPVDTLMIREMFRMMIDNFVTQDPLEGPVLLALFPQCDIISAGCRRGLRLDKPQRKITHLTL